MMIKDAAKELNINYENAKAINRVWRFEARDEKKKIRERKKLSKRQRKPAKRVAP